METTSRLRRKPYLTQTRSFALIKAMDRSPICTIRAIRVATGASLRRAIAMRVRAIRRVHQLVCAIGRGEA